MHVSLNADPLPVLGEGGKDVAAHRSLGFGRACLFT